MNRIALVGVPGSGKSEVARGLYDAITKADLTCSECWTPVDYIDDYIDDISDEADLALGFEATYIGNLHVALGRAARERNASVGAKTLITCGTLFETATHAALAFEREQEFIDTDEERHDLAQRVEGMMRILACLFVDTVQYDYVFYLPPKELTEDTTILDRNLRSAFDAWRLYPVVYLDHENPVDQIMMALGLKEKDEGYAERAGTSAQGSE